VKMVSRVKVGGWFADRIGDIKNAYVIEKSKKMTLVG
jgi:hypothetical protein